MSCELAAIFLYYPADSRNKTLATEGVSQLVLHVGGLIMKAIQIHEYGDASVRRYEESREALEEIAAMVDRGKLRPVIRSEISLANASQAHEAKGGNGKTIIRVG